MSTRNKRIYDQWMVLQDIMGDAKLWPTKIRKYFWTLKNLTNWERKLTCVFVFINGLNPEIFLEWVDLIDPNSAGRRYMESLLNKFEAHPSLYELYGFDVSTGHYHWLNGRRYRRP